MLFKDLYKKYNHCLEFNDISINAIFTVLVLNKNIIWYISKILYQSHLQILNIFMIKSFIVLIKKAVKVTFSKWKIIIMFCASYSYASIYITSNNFSLQMSRVKIYVIFIVIWQITEANKKLNSTPPYEKIITTKLLCLKT